MEQGVISPSGEKRWPLNSNPFSFYVTAGPGPEFHDVFARTRYTPGDDEIRMRLELSHLTL